MEHNIKKINWKDEQSFEKFYSIFCLSFPDEPDLGYENIKNWVAERENFMIIYGLFVNDILIGFRHIWFAPNNRYCNVPYAGMHPEYRGYGLYPKFCLETEKDLNELGFTVITNEVENPDFISDPTKKCWQKKELRCLRIN